MNCRPRRWPLAKFLLAFPPALVLAAGCATSPQVVTLNPRPRVTGSAVGRNVPLVLRTRDQRPDRIIGYQRQTEDENKGPIIAAGKMTHVLYREIAAGLRQKGFESHKYTGPSEQKPRLTVTLEQFSYSPGAGRKVHVRVKLRARATTANRIYHFTYSVDKGKRQGLLHGRKQNQRMINTALGSVLHSLLEDHRLISALADAGNS